MGLTTAIWQIAYRKKAGDIKFHIIKAGYKAWVADPFLYEKGNNTYLFAEYWEYSRNRGAIAVCNISKRNPKWSVIIRENYHLSYPHIFNINNEIYMCPEANESNSIYLYRSIKFPYEWEKLPPLYQDIHAVDTTFFEFDGQILGFTFDLDREQLFLVRFNKQEKLLELLSKTPVSSGSYGCRMGGGILIKKDNLIRVSQDCSCIYGGALIFHKFQLDGPNYKETFYKRIAPGDIPLLNNKRYYGVHTYNETNQYEVVDLKYRHFNLLELYYRIKRRLSKIL